MPHRQDDRADHQDQRHLQPRHDDVPDVGLVEEGDAEIAAGGIAQKVQILLPQRQIEAELVVDPGDQLGRRAAAQHGHGRVSRDEPDKEEHHQADPEQDRNHLQHAPNQEGGHCAPTPPSMVSALPVTKRASSEAR